MNDELLIQLHAAGAEINDTLARFVDDKETYLKYVLAFPEEPTMARLAKAMADKDYAEAEEAAHALKGLTRNLGFVPLGDACMDMQEDLMSQEIDDALDDFETLKKQYQIFCDIILKSGN